MNLPKIYKDKDTDIGLIQDKCVGIIGYGNQGRAQALNLRDSGVDVRIGLRKDSGRINEVRSEDLNCLPIREAVENCVIISILVPDQVMGDIYKTEINPYLRDGQTLLFSHGYNIHFKIIQPPNNVNVVMIAPSGPGSEVRKQYEHGGGIPGLIAVHQDYTGNAFDLALSYSKAIGLTRLGVFKSTFKEETETDLFGEQIILTGGIPKLIQSSYKVLLESGYSPVTSWFVCYYELKTIVDLFHSKGFEFMNSAISDTAEYGGITRGSRIIDKHVRDVMRNVLDEIQSGKFHKEWMKETEGGFPTLSKLRKEEKKLPIEEVGQQILKELFESK